MRYWIALPALFLIADGISAREWTSRQGNRMEAEFSSVRGDAVLLRAGGRRVQVPFADLVPEDQRFVREQLIKSGREKLLKGLPGHQSIESAEEKDAPPSVSPVGRTARSRSPQRTTPASSDVEYGAPLKTELRIWTDIRNQKIRAAYRGMNGTQVILQRGSQRMNLELENFSAQDQLFVREALTATDELSNLLTAQGLDDVTPEQVAAEYGIPEQSETRLWNADRGGQFQFVGAYRGMKKLSVVIEVNGKFRNHRVNGLSPVDAAYVQQQLKETDGLAAFEAAGAEAEALARKLEQERKAREAERERRVASSPRRSYPSSYRLDREDPFERMRERQRERMEEMRQRHEDAHRRHQEHIAEIFDRPRTGPSSFVYEFNCPNCGHRWEAKTPIDNCDRCASQRSESVANRSSSSRSWADIESHNGNNGNSGSSSGSSRSYRRTRIPIRGIVFLISVVGAGIAGLWRLLTGGGNYDDDYDDDEDDYEDEEDDDEYY